MAYVYIGVGSNQGDKEKNIRKAVDSIKQECRVLKVSSLYETEPMYYKEQGLFLNCAICMDTELKPKNLLDFLLEIEKKLGRVRDEKSKYGPRIIDLDIIFYNNKIINEDGLVIPHPKLHERAFVLEPIKEINPEFIDPILKKSIKELCTRIKNNGCTRIKKF